MNNEIQLVSDGDGLAVIGNPTDVERFLLDQGLDRIPSRDLDLPRLGSLLGTGGAAAKVGSELAENSGRWVKLTKESAEAIKKYGLTSTKTPGVSHAMIGKPGEIKQWLQIAQAPVALLSGPMALSALSTMMQQRAMQQQMDEIVEYLQEINEKVDDILRNQKDAVLAGMIGAELIIEEALTVREQVGRVSEVTWSKVQATSMTIASTQAYALRQLDGIAKKLKKKADLGEIAKATDDAAPKVREWLAVLARCFQLQNGVSVLELDRVLDASPEEIDRHRRGLTIARQNRLELITRSTARLLTQMDETVQKANSKVLFHPRDSPAAVRSSKRSRVKSATSVNGSESSPVARHRRRSDGGRQPPRRETKWSQPPRNVSMPPAASAQRPSTKQPTHCARSTSTATAPPSKPRVLSAMENAALGKAADAAGAVGSLLHRKKDSAASAETHRSDPAV